MLSPKGQQAAASARAGRLHGRVGPRSLLTLLLVAAFGASLVAAAREGTALHPGGARAAREIAGALFHPDLSPGTLRLALGASWQTVAYATAGTSLALAVAIPAGVLASGVLVRGALARVAVTAAFRGLLGFLRAIHELVWAWLFVAAMGLTPLAAVLALALPYAGILGRILAERLADVPEAPLCALRAAGGSELQVLLYGRLPQALPDFVAYTLYRFECGIRSAAIMSFVGLQGLGYQIQLALDDLRYGELWTFVFFLVALVLAVDRWSSIARRALAP